MSDILYSKLRLEVPQELDGESATITSSKGISRNVTMSSPITDIMLAGMEKYRVQAGVTDESISLGYGQIKRVEAAFITILKKLLYEYYDSSAIILNNEIHILGSRYSTGSYPNYNYLHAKKHYKFDGTSWVSVSTLPYNFYEGEAVVLNGEIHILGGGGSDDRKKHYKFDGTSWVSVSTLPYEFLDGSAIVLNNEIHILGSSYSTGSYPNYSYPHARKHYKFNGTSWVSVSTLPYDFYEASAAVLNNEIHILGSGYSSSSNNQKHYKFNGASWVSVSTLPYGAYNASAVVLNNEIHILGGGSTSDHQKHYKFNGTSWVSVSTLPYEFSEGSTVVWKNGYNKIVILGTSYGSSNYFKDAEWDGTSWTLGTD